MVTRDELITWLEEMLVEVQQARREAEEKYGMQGTGL